MVKSTFNCFVNNEFKRIKAFEVELPKISAKKSQKLTLKSFVEV